MERSVWNIFKILSIKEDMPVYLMVRQVLIEYIKSKDKNFYVDEEKFLDFLCSVQDRDRKLYLQKRKKMGKLDYPAGGLKDKILKEDLDNKLFPLGEEDV